VNSRQGGDIGVHASISVAQALLAADVVDELRLVIGPMIVGGGRRLLDGLPSIQLELIEARPHRLAICSSTIALVVRAWRMTV
jgi:riboflavin biosynthesis pyrimidine reductase